MVDVMRIIVTSFKRPHVHTTVFRAPDPTAGYHRPPPETPRHSWASLDQSLVGSLVLFPGS